MSFRDAFAEDYAREAEATRLAAEQELEREGIRTEADAAPEPRNDGRLVLSFAEFAVERFEAADSLWGDAFLVRGGGYLILGGEGGVGKTVLLVNLVVRMAAGEQEFLGFKLPGRKVPVLFLEAEGSRTRFRDWIMKIAQNLGHDPKDLPIFFHRRDVRLEIDDNLRAMIDQSKAELVVLDPIGAFFHGEENSSTEWRNGLSKPLRKFSQDLGVVFAFCDHVTKTAKDQTGRGKMRGSGAKSDDAGAIMRLEIPEAGKPARTLFVDRVRDGELPEPSRIALRIDLKPGTIARDDRQDAEDARPSGPTPDARQAHVVAIVADISARSGGLATTAEIAVRLKDERHIERSQAEELIKSTLDAGLIERLAQGKYRLPGAIR